MNIEKESHNKNYTRGLLNSVTRAMVHVEGKISKIKENPLQQNTPKHIFYSGKLKAYNEMLQYLKSKKLTIEDYKNPKQETFKK